MSVLTTPSSLSKIEHENRNTELRKVFDMWSEVATRRVAAATRYRLPGEGSAPPALTTGRRYKINTCFAKSHFDLSAQIWKL
ncbi:unnamed protein product [Pieris brassicae]|uniref:Uncharacterized protein n=1 Tax=Pieris brassicae TaxID=7116 RepID=A0A9P0TPG0_PIEBR|nr:unnamed protein product [Pieris brassicae]